MKLNTAPKLILLAILLAATATMNARYSCCTPLADVGVPTMTDDEQITKKEMMTMDNGIKYTILKEGDGAAAVNGDLVVVHYTGTFKDGRKFDSSLDRGQPFEFRLGAGSVIRGWDLGVRGMKIGEKRELHIPSSLAYGARGAGGVIPPNTDLIFTIELLNLK